jgi:hypothetical protein
MSKTDYSTGNWTLRTQLDFSKTFAVDHAVSLSAGMEWRQNKQHVPNVSVRYGYNPTSLSYTNIDIKTMYNMGTRESYIYNNNVSATAVRDGSYNRLLDPSFSPYLSSTFNRYFGGYLVGGYTYKERYGISGSFRIDQANLFGTDPKYRYRPLWSVGLKWNMAKEKFMKSLLWIDVLDIRGSYGLTGNVDQTTSPYLVARMYTQNRWTSETIPFTYISEAPNPLLRWEKTATLNLGFDFILLKGKLSGKFDYYHKKSDDLLATIEVPFSSGYSRQRVNYGAMTNDGFEISLSSPWYSNADWSFLSSFTFSYNKNKVTKSYYIPTQASQLVASGTYYLEGNPLNSIYAYRYGGLTKDGTDEQNGIPNILRADGSSMVHLDSEGNVDIDQSSSLTPDDVVYMGSGTPVWGGSFSQSVRYKNWELSMFFVFYGGHKVYVPSYNFYSSNANEMSDFYAQSWSPENPDSEVPKNFIYYPTSTNGVIGLQEIYQKSTVNVKDGDFLRFKNLSLSYSLPKNFIRKLWLDEVRIIFQVDNLFCWSAAGHGIDPETLGTSGAWTLPEPTSYLLKLNLQF